MEINEETKARLKKIGSVGASYDAVINECIDKLEKVEALVDIVDDNMSGYERLYCELIDIFKIGDK